MMQFKVLVKRWSLLGVFLMLGVSSVSFWPLPPRQKALSAAESLPPHPVILLLDEQVYTLRIPPPAMPSALRTQSATITVKFLAAGQQDAFGTSCLTWPDNAKTAYQHAANLWAAQIHSTAPLVIEACWADLGANNVLGYGGSYGSYRNFPNAPVANTWYPVALANALAGSDRNGSEPEIFTTYNKNFTWYFSTDGQTPAGQVDFVTVVLHEITHGLGFIGSMEVSGGAGSFGSGTPLAPDIYDRFTEDGGGTPLINYANPSSALGTALTSNNVWFNGPHARAANGGGRVKLYAPATWLEGSSYAHLDYDTYRNGPHALMVYKISAGSSIHDPGTITRGILQDLGWSIGTPNLSTSTKQVRPDQASLGEVVTFTVRLVNSGALKTTVRFTDTLPTVLQLHGSPTASAGPPPSVNGATLTWQGTVTDGTTITLTYAAEVLSDTVAAVNQAVVDDGNGQRYTLTALVNGRKIFLPLVLRAYQP